MGPSPVSSRVPRDTRSGERRDAVVCLPDTDAEFREAVEAAIAGADGTEPDLASIVQRALQTRYPRAAMIPRSELGQLDRGRAWYALRDGRSSRTDPRRILVVDDNEALTAVVVQAFSDDGFECRAAHDGAAALAVLAEWTPDLIVLDLQMPTMSGEEFARRYHDQPGPHAPIVVVTGARDPEVHLAGLQIRSIIEKPFDLEQLTRLVDRYA